MSSSGSMLRLLTVLTLLTTGYSQVSIPDGPRGAGTAFIKCGGGFFGGSKRCFEVTLSKLVVQIGEDGTNDDVTVKICSDASTTCCTTPPLKKTFSDDWSRNDLEEWGARYLGDCAAKKFAVEKGLGVTLAKQGGDSLEVTSVVVEAQSGEEGKKVEQKFKCGAWSIGDGSGGGSKLCGTSQYGYEEVKKVTVTMGNEGTNDDVRVDICSAVEDVCCRTKLSSLISDDWSRNDVETWTAGDLGECQGVRYRVEGGIELTLVKDGEDDLVVNKIIVETADLGGSAKEYDCKGFTLTGGGQNCKTGGGCQVKNLCLKKGMKTGPSSGKIATTTRPAGSSSRPSGGLLAQAGALLGGFGAKRTTTTTTQGTTTRTTRAPFFG